jgi:ubiquitin C-terminal hydrolase
VAKKRYVEMKDYDGETSADCAKRWLEMSKGRDDSLVTDIFEGQYLKYFKCSKCGFKSRNCDTFISLSVTINSTHSKLDDSFKDQFRTKSGDGYKCSKCKSSCEVYCGLYRLPKVLVIHLERFEAKGIRTSKLNHSISIPLELDLTN